MDNLSTFSVHNLFEEEAGCIRCMSCGIVRNFARYRPFFDLCDGIFLNYNWTESGLGGSHDLAGERRGEVYVGVDVFGRGCYGGGGFNSCKVRIVVSGA